MSCSAASTVRPSPCQRSISCDELGDGLGIDGAERLVEQDEGGVLQQQARKQHPLELAARQGAHRPVGEIEQPERSKRPGDGAPACSIEPAPGADLAPQSHGHAVEHRDGKAAVDLDLLRQISDVALVEAVELEAATERLELAHDALEQGRLAGAVRPDNGEKLAARHLAVDVMHGRMPVIAERQVAKGDRRFHVRRQGHAKAQATAPQSSAAAAATRHSRAGTERRNSEMPEATGGLNSASSLSPSTTVTGATSAT